MTQDDELEVAYRRLLRFYPRRWRVVHEDAMVAVLLDEAEAEGRRHASLASATDLVGHGVEARLEALLSWIPVPVRERVSIAAVVVGAAVGLVLLVGEVVGARLRPPEEEVVNFGGQFLSGPFLTTGIGLYLAVMSAALLTVVGRTGVARTLLLGAVGFGVWMRSPLPWSTPYPTPSTRIVLLLVLLAGLGALATIRSSRRTSRRMVGVGAVLVLVLALSVGLLATRPLLGWSVGTMAHSGNVAAAAFALVLAVLGGLALLAVAVAESRHPGWSLAVAVALVPVVLFCSDVAVSVNPLEGAYRAWVPVGHLVVVVAVHLLGRHRGRLGPAA